MENSMNVAGDPEVDGREESERQDGEGVEERIQTDDEAKEDDLREEELGA